MKKTLIALMALAGVAAADPALWTSTNEGIGGTAAGNFYYGWTLQLDDADHLVTTCSKPELTLPTTVKLTTVTFTTRPSGGFGSDAKLAVYEYVSDGQVGDLVALSENTTGTYAANTAVTLNFDAVEISTNKRYQFLFVDTESTMENVATFDDYQAHASSQSLALVDNNGIPSGWGTYSTPNLDGWASQWMPKLTIVTAPEPATATLSLLALAGLASRRRRH